MQYKVEPFWQSDRQPRNFSFLTPDPYTAIEVAQRYANKFGIEMAMIAPGGDLEATFLPTGQPQ